MAIRLTIQGNEELKATFQELAKRINDSTQLAVIDLEITIDFLINENISIEYLNACFIKIDQILQKNNSIKLLLIRFYNINDNVLQYVDFSKTPNLANKIEKICLFFPIEKALARNMSDFNSFVSSIAANFKAIKEFEISWFCRLNNESLINSYQAKLLEPQALLDLLSKPAFKSLKLPIQIPCFGRGPYNEKEILIVIEAFRNAQLLEIFYGNLYGFSIDLRILEVILSRQLREVMLVLPDGIELKTTESLSQLLTNAQNLRSLEINCTPKDLPSIFQALSKNKKIKNFILGVLITSGEIETLNELKFLEQRLTSKIQQKANSNNQPFSKVVKNELEKFTIKINYEKAGGLPLKYSNDLQNCLFNLFNEYSFSLLKLSELSISGFNLNREIISWIESIKTLTVLKIKENYIDKKDAKDIVSVCNANPGLELFYLSLDTNARAKSECRNILTEIANKLVKTTIEDLTIIFSFFSIKNKPLKKEEVFLIFESLLEKNLSIKSINLYFPYSYGKGINILSSEERIKTLTSENKKFMSVFKSLSEQYLNGINNRYASLPDNNIGLKAYFDQYNNFLIEPVSDGIKNKYPTPEYYKSVISNLFVAFVAEVYPSDIASNKLISKNIVSETVAPSVFLEMEPCIELFIAFINKEKTFGMEIDYQLINKLRKSEAIAYYKLAENLFRNILYDNDVITLVERYEITLYLLRYADLQDKNVQEFCYKVASGYLSVKDNRNPQPQHTKEAMIISCATLFDVKLSHQLPLGTDITHFNPSTKKYNPVLSSDFLQKNKVTLQDQLESENFIFLEDILCNYIFSEKSTNNNQNLVNEIDLIKFEKNIIHILNQVKEKNHLEIQVKEISEYLEKANDSLSKIQEQCTAYDMSESLKPLQKTMNSLQVMLDRIATNNQQEIPQVPSEMQPSNNAREQPQNASKFWSKTENSTPPSEDVQPFKKQRYNPSS